MTLAFGAEPPGNSFNIVQATVPAGASRLTGYVGMCDNAINNTGNYDSSNYVEIDGAATDWRTDKGNGTDGLTLLGTTKKFVAGDLSNGYDSFDVDVTGYAYVQFRTYNGNYAHTDHITYFDTQFAVALDTTDADAAAAVDALIQALPEASAVTFADAAQIEAARAAYEALTVTQKAFVTSLAALGAAEAAFAYCYPEGTLIWAEDTALSATAGNLRVALVDGSGHKFSYTQNETNEFEHGFRFDSSDTEYDTITIAVPKGAFFFSTFFGRDYGASTLNGGGDNKVGHADFYIGEGMVATALHEDGKGNYVYFSIPEGTETISIRVYMGENNWRDHMIFANALFVSSVDDTPANYDAVDAAVAAAGEIDRTAYTVASCKAVDAAVAAVVRGKFASEQENVDAMAAAITAAIEAVVRDLTADEQATVNGYAAAIEAAISALTPKAVEMELTISTGMVTKAAAAGKYDITWNARILLGEELKVEDINAAGVKFKNYGVYYGTGKDVLNDYKNATADQIRQVVFAEGEDVDIYTAYGFRLRNVLEERVRAAMFYVEYELNGHTYILLSTVDEAIAIIAE